MQVSIILPTYNGAAYIRRAIDSVIAQTYIDWELIVIDDGSTADIQSLLPSDARIRYIKNEINLGIQKTLNRGLVEAKGTYIARIDDDDVWNDLEKLAKQVAFLETHLDHTLVGTGVIIVDEKGKELQRYLLPQADENIRAKMLRKNCFIHSSVMFRNTGLWYSEDSEVRHVEDYELWLRLGLQGKLANLSTHSVTYTIRKDSLTVRNRRIQGWHMVKLALQYRTKYPSALFGLATSMTRYLFFVSQAIIPFPSKLRYWIQKKQKSM